MIHANPYCIFFLVSGTMHFKHEMLNSYVAKRQYATSENYKCKSDKIKKMAHLTFFTELLLRTHLKSVLKQLKQFLSTC